MEHQETRAFMTAFGGLKAASKKLQEMSRAAEPDLDDMLVEVQNAKRFYDDCTLVINRIKQQVDMIFADADTSDTAPRLASEVLSDPVDIAATKPVSIARSVRPQDHLDDDIPFAPAIG